MLLIKVKSVYFLVHLEDPVTFQSLWSKSMTYMSVFSCVGLQNWAFVTSIFCAIKHLKIVKKPQINNILVHLTAAHAQIATSLRTKVLLVLVYRIMCIIGNRQQALSLNLIEALALALLLEHIRYVVVRVVILYVLYLLYQVLHL